MSDKSMKKLTIVHGSQLGSKDPDVLEFKKRLEKLESKKIIEKELKSKSKINNSLANAFQRTVNAGFSKVG